MQQVRVKNVDLARAVTALSKVSDTKSDVRFGRLRMYIRDKQLVLDATDGVVVMRTTIPCQFDEGFSDWVCVVLRAGNPIKAFLKSAAEDITIVQKDNAVMFSDQIGDLSFTMQQEVGGSGFTYYPVGDDAKDMYGIRRDALLTCEAKELIPALDYCLGVVDPNRTELRSILFDATTRDIVAVDGRRIHCHRLEFLRWERSFYVPYQVLNILRGRLTKEGVVKLFEYPMSYMSLAEEGSMLYFMVTAKCAGDSEETYHIWCQQNTTPGFAEAYQSIFPTDGKMDTEYVSVMVHAASVLKVLKALRTMTGEKAGIMQAGEKALEFTVHSPELDASTARVACELGRNSASVDILANGGTLPKVGVNFDYLVEAVVGNVVEICIPIDPSEIILVDSRRCMSTEGHFKAGIMPRRF